MKSSSLVAAAFLAVLPAVAGAQDHCSRETLSVRGTPVSISYCLTAPPSGSGPDVTVAVKGTYTSSTASFSRASAFHFITGDGPARVLENVDLAQLGLTGTLHLTLAYSGGLVKIESAMLTPGAIVIK